LLLPVTVRQIFDTNDPGFSLVEVLVAVALLVTGAMALAQLFTVAAASNARAADMTYAAVLAAQKVEELRVATTLPAESGLDYVDRRGEARRPEEAAYARRWSVEPLAADVTGTLVVVRVVVTPHAGGAEARFVTVRAVEGP
jgi:prepilin-type N-terminal cleavage/methylation domain-containing protein